VDIVENSARSRLQSPSSATTCGRPGSGVRPQCTPVQPLPRGAHLRPRLGPPPAKPVLTPLAGRCRPITRLLFPFTRCALPPLRCSGQPSSPTAPPAPRRRPPRRRLPPSAPRGPVRPHNPPAAPALLGVHQQRAHRTEVCAASKRGCPRGALGPDRETNNPHFQQKTPSMRPSDSSLLHVFNSCGYFCGQRGFHPCKSPFIVRRNGGRWQSRRKKTHGLSGLL
jgi:hypothetical protein